MHLRALRDALEAALEARLRVSIGGLRPTSTGRGSLTNRCQLVLTGPGNSKSNTEWSKGSDPGARGSHRDMLAAQAALAPGLTKGTTGLRPAGMTEVVIDHAEN